MNIVRVISNVYGDLRGYQRSRIWREVSLNMRKPSSEISVMGADLFQRRVQDAITRFPLYADKVRSHCGALPSAGTIVTPTDLPIWTKADQNKLFQSLNAPPMDGAFLHATGGSTGVPTRFYITRESYEWRTAVADRGYSWANAEEGARSFYVWSTAVRPPPWMTAMKQNVHRWALGRKYFSLFHFNEARKRECCREINSYRPLSLVSYSGNLLELALYVRDHSGLLQWHPKTIVGAAEGLPPGGRETVEAFLGGKVFMSYGSREFMLIGMECDQHAGYHIPADNLFVEVVDDAGRPTKPGETGRILVTDLRNPATPFIRYEIGDRGALAEDSPCACGCSFPRLAIVEGRCGEYVELPDGSRLTAIFIAHTFKEFQWINGFQIIQPDKNGITIRLITGAPLNSLPVADLERNLREKMGMSLQINFMRVLELEKTASGKTPPIVRSESDGRV